MKLNAEELAEVRAAHVAQLAREKFAVRRAAVIADDVAAMRDTENELLERFANTPDLKALIKVALTSAPDVTGRAFVAHVSKVIFDHAEEDAEVAFDLGTQKASTEKMQV